MLRVIQKREMYQPIVDLGDRVKVAFDYEVLFNEDEDGNKTPSDVGIWTEAIIKPKPSLEQIKSFILNAINKYTDERIVSGFEWNGMSVWLSNENQFNYKAAYDLAVQTNGANLPIVFKFGDNANPQYYKFDTVAELQDFYIKAMTYINEQLAVGWYKKDAIDWSQYEL